MKMPDEIKSGIAICNCFSGKCVECPYYNESSTSADCSQFLGVDILAYIAQLEEQLHDATKMAALTESAPTWISIKEKLPEREKKVLVVNGHGYISILAFWKKESNNWTWIKLGHFVHVNDITHWMSLPEPPKGRRHR